MVYTVSVIIPFYGNTHSQRLGIVTETILAQKGINIDLIIAGLNTATRIKANNYLENLPLEKVPEIVQTGKIINRGLKLVKGDFVYVSDADILFSNNFYLEKLVQESLSQGTSLKRPPMRRLLLPDFEWFYQNFSLGGLEDSLKKLDFSQEYIVKPKGSSRPMRIFPKFEHGKQKVFIASEPDFQEYISNKDNLGKEPAFFNQDRHCGAIFSRTEDFLNIGGYHEGFISWGAWDADAQWKLEEKIGMQFIPNQKEFEVIHLDHPKGYFSQPKWDTDKELQRKRRLLGAEECIKKDKEIYLEAKN